VKRAVCAVLAAIAGACSSDVVDPTDAAPPLVGDPAAEAARVRAETRRMEAELAKLEAERDRLIAERDRALAASASAVGSSSAPPAPAPR
jgi:hypothetical protein